MSPTEDYRFPIYVRLDDGGVLRIDAKDRILADLEPIDIENDEYLFWDAAGVACKVMLTGRVGWFHNPNVSGLCKAQNPITLEEAFREWASQLGVQVDTTGTPEQICDQLRSAQANLPRRLNLLSRLFATRRR